MALGAETSVVLALRRDMRDAPDHNSYDETWAGVAQDEVTLATGRFSVTVTDARSRLDVNGLGQGGLVQTQALARLMAALDLPPDLAAGIAGEIARDGPVAALDRLRVLDPVTVQRLQPYVDALPVPGKVNVNTADAVLIGALMQNPSRAAALAARRKRAGHLTPEDVGDVGLAGATLGFTSDLFDVTTRAEVDGVTVVLTSRLMRTSDRDGDRVRVIRRRFGPDPADLPDPPAPAGAQP